MKSEDAPVFVMVDRDKLDRDLEIVTAHLHAIRSLLRKSGADEAHLKSLRLMVERLDAIRGEL